MQIHLVIFKKNAKTAQFRHTLILKNWCHQAEG